MGGVNGTGEPVINTGLIPFRVCSMLVKPNYCNSYNNCVTDSLLCYMCSSMFLAGRVFVADNSLIN